MSDEPKPGDIIQAAKIKFMALQRPLLMGLAAYKRDPNVLDIHDSKLTAMRMTATALEILSGFTPSRLDKDENYAAAILASIAIIDKNSEHRLAVPTLLREQDIGIDLPNIVSSDQTLIQGLRLIKTHVMMANPVNLDAEVEKAIGTIRDSATASFRTPG